MPVQSRSMFRFSVVAVGLGTVVLAGCSSTAGSRPSSAAAPSSLSAAAPTTSARAPTPVALRVESTALGKLLADPRGFTLYTFKHDRNGTSACTGGCATEWPPFTIQPGARPVAPTGPVGTLATIMRVGGTEQVTLDGRPLYRFSGDTAPGQTHGQDFLHAWFVVRIGTAPAVHHAPPASTPAPPMTHTAPPPMTHTAPPPMTHTAPPDTVTPTRMPSTHQPAPSSPPANCIPQGGGGDGDGDNRGGPSDGDGCT